MLSSTTAGEQHTCIFVHRNTCCQSLCCQSIKESLCYRVNLKILLSLKCATAYFAQQICLHQLRLRQWFVAHLTYPAAAAAIHGKRLR